jgi:hypothetical protein
MEIRPAQTFKVLEISKNNFKIPLKKNLRDSPNLAGFPNIFFSKPNIFSRSLNFNKEITMRYRRSLPEWNGTLARGNHKLIN